MSCNACGRRAPTKYVEFYQNIGMLVMRTSKSVKGDLCKTCIDKYFWQLTLTTAFLGWWGMISMVLTPIFLANNIFRFCATIKVSRAVLPPVDVAPREHPTLSLTEDARMRLGPFGAELRQRLSAGADLEAVAAEVARKASVSAVQAELFAREQA